MSPPIPLIPRPAATTAANHRSSTPTQHCPLRELTQFECELQPSGYACVPFTRLFRECVGVRRAGKSRVPVRLEVTSDATV